jgi:hypothetical protein
MPYYFTSDEASTPSPISSDYSGYSFRDPARIDYESEDDYYDDKPPSPTESDHSLSVSFSSVATTEFVQFLSDIEFTPAGIPSEMVPAFFIYAINRGIPTDVFEEPREENVTIEQMPSSYLDWVEYGIPLSRFLFAEYWISWRATRRWDEEDEREINEFEQRQEWKQRLALVKEELRKQKHHQNRNKPSGQELRVWQKPSSVALSPLRFAPLRDDRRSKWLSETNKHRYGGLWADKRNNFDGNDSAESSSPLSGSTSSVKSRLNSGSSRTEKEPTTTTLAREYRKRFGGTWNVVQMAGGRIPRYVEEMQATIMRKIHGSG